MTKIAGVSVDIENLPTREQMYALAINTKEFVDNPLRSEQIKKALNDSGLWNDDSYENSEEGTKGIVYRKTPEEADQEIKELNKNVVEPKEEKNGLHTTTSKKNPKSK